LSGNGIQYPDYYLSGSIFSDISRPLAYRTDILFRALAVIPLFIPLGTPPLHITGTNADNLLFTIAFWTDFGFSGHDLTSIIKVETQLVMII
jgi:hypothetical protein